MELRIEDQKSEGENGTGNRESSSFFRTVKGIINQFSKNSRELASVIGERERDKAGILNRQSCSNGKN